MEDLSPSLPDADLAAALVRNAGNLAAKLRNEGLIESEKTSVSDIVTNADIAAEAYITEQLQRCRPQDGILGEEGAAADSASGRTWVIDPVDGTYNFASHFSYWCSALALVSGPLDADAQPLIGAVYQPQEDALWLGGTGAPATCNGLTLGQSENAQLTQISLGTYLHPTYLTDPDVAQPFARVASQVATVRMLGSGSCDLARVADGRLGCWMQHSTALWDWLPGKALVRAAGGDTAVVVINGYRWHLAGNSTAVAQMRELLGQPN